MPKPQKFQHSNACYMHNHCSGLNMEKTIVFDTGSIISLTANNLLWILEPLKESFGGTFVVSRSARQELIDKPLNIKRYEFEALQVLRCFKKGTLSVVKNNEVYDLAKKIEDAANRLVVAHGSPVRIVSSADAECVAATIVLNAAALVIDERTTRLLVEERERIKKIMEAKLQTSVSLDNAADKELAKLVPGVK